MKEYMQIDRSFLACLELDGVCKAVSVVELMPGGRVWLGLTCSHSQVMKKSTWISIPFKIKKYYSGRFSD